MKALKIAEIFYSLAGEGHRVGTPSIFVRFAECNVGCSFCDTDYSLRRTLATDEILQEIKQYPCKEIVFTGGEPAMQLTEEIVQFFKDAGFYTCIETSGSLPIPSNLDYVCLSPKVSNEVLLQNFGDRAVDEIKYVMSASRSLPTPPIAAAHYFLSPQFDGGHQSSALNKAALQHCIELCKQHPTWRLSTQSHKFWEVR